MQRAHKIRMYPNGEQTVLLAKAAGTARYTYNWALAEWKAQYEAYRRGEVSDKPSWIVLDALWTKARPEWTREVPRCSQNHAIRMVGTAYTNFFAGRAARPAFKKKSSSKQSFYLPNEAGTLHGATLRQSKIGDKPIHLAEKLRFNGHIMSYTVSCEAGQWYVSVQVQCKEPKAPARNPDSIVGIDVGLHCPAVASDGTRCEAPASLERLERKLKDAQRAQSRCQRGSRNRFKRKRRLQRIQMRINNIRKDVTHKFTSTITKNHGIVVTETLKIEEMKRKAETRSFRRCFAHSMMGEILRQIAYKADLHVAVSPFYPSTKTCSACGAVKKRISLSARTYRCAECGAVIDRDLNAALNQVKAYTGPVRPSVPVEPRCKPVRRSRKSLSSKAV